MLLYIERWLKATEFLGPVDPESFVLVPDPEDRKFAALSAAAQASLVTSDDHLLSHRSIGVDVLTPRAFLARAGGTPYLYPPRV